jgi:hypothetical protein
MAAANPKELALDKMRKIAVEELRLKNIAEKAEEEAENARLELDNASDTQPRPDNMQEYIDNEHELTEIAKKTKEEYEAAKDEYVKVFYEGINVGLSYIEMQTAAKTEIAADTNTDIIVRGIFRDSLVGKSPIYTQEMIDKATKSRVSVGIESKLMQLYRCLSVNISQELFYLTYRAIPDNTRLQSAIVYELEPLKLGVPRVIPPGVLSDVKKVISSIEYDSIKVDKSNNDKSYISYPDVPVLSGTLKLHKEITDSVKAEYKETDKPSTIPLFFIFITPGGHASLIIYIPQPSTGSPKLFSFGLGFGGEGSGSGPTAAATGPITGQVQLYSPDFLMKPESGKYKLIDMGFLKQKHIDRINVYLKSGGNVNINLRNNVYINSEERSEVAKEKENVLKENVIKTLEEYLTKGYLDSFASLPAQRGGTTSETGFHYFYSSIKLNKTYSYVSAGVGLTKDYLNCTSFLSDIFSDRITCGIRQTGYLVADPVQCVGYAALKMNKNVQAAHDKAKKTKSILHFFTKQPNSDYKFREIYKSQMNNIFVGVFMSIYLETNRSTGYLKNIFDYLNYEDRTMLQKAYNYTAKCVGAACEHPLLSATLAAGTAAAAAGLALHTLPRGGTRRAKQRKNRRSTQRRT